MPGPLIGLGASEPTAAKAEYSQWATVVERGEEEVAGLWVQAFLDFEAGEPARALIYIARIVLLGPAAASGYYLGAAF